MIIQKLFARAGDEDVRAQYTQTLAKIALSDQNDSSAIAAKTTAILHDIKEDRIKRATAWADHKAQAANEKRAREISARRQENENDIEFIFSDVFCDAFDRKLQVMWAGVKQRPVDDVKLPFTVSADFSRIFESVVRDTFMPWIVAKSRYIINDAARKEPSLRRRYLEKRLNDPKTAKELWNIWEQAWHHFLQEATYPEKPEEEKGGLFGSIKRAVKDTIADEEAYSVEDWQHDVQVIDEQNAETREIIKKLTSPSTVYQPPSDDDMTVLMNIFAIIPGDLRKEISDIRQIVAQEESAGRVFESFEKGRDLQLALIAVSFKDPDTYLLGEKKMLKHLLAGKKGPELRSTMPFLMRVMGDLL